MADEVIEIPLFPLNLVLFPGMAQPLHIFEPRYREMTRFCLDSNITFGITLALPGSELEHEIPARIGSLARILSYQRLADGRYNLITAGGQRFEVLEVRHDKPYLCGRARLLPETLGEGDLAALTGETRALLDDYLGLILAITGSGEKTLQAPSDTIELSYFIAVCLPCDDEVKQALLESATAVERLTRERDLLRKEIGVISAQLYSDACDDNDTLRQPGDNRDHLN